MPVLFVPAVWTDVLVTFALPRVATALMPRLLAPDVVTLPLVTETAPPLDDA